jgi:hypothetical protein
MGSTTTYGSGPWNVSLPVNAHSINNAILSMVMLKMSTAWYNGLAQNSYNGTNTKVNLVSSSGTTGIPVTSIQPFTWAEGDKIVINGSYESV